MAVRKAEPVDYQRLFENYPEGAIVLEDLIKRFGGNLFVKGGQEGDRQTAFNLGARAALDFILRQINKANGVSDEDIQVQTDE